jgi:hypothetical protein
MKKNIFNDPQKRAELIFNQHMYPCPECGSYNLIYQTPIILNEPVPESFDAKKLLGIYARTIKNGHTLLRGDAFLMCKDCGHKGPPVDVSGRTAEDVGQDPIIASKIKHKWNKHAE